MNKAIGIMCAIGGVIMLIFIFSYNTPTGRAIVNTYDHTIQTIDDATNYKTRKKVEDSCRAMISSYEADRLTYEQFKDSESDECKDWAAQAKMRANKTASTYNNYVLQNNYVWSDNVPADIKQELEYIE